jgi:hypothetical protein
LAASGWPYAEVAPWRPAARQVFDQKLLMLFEIFENMKHSKNAQTSIRKGLGGVLASSWNFSKPS